MNDHVLLIEAGAVEYEVMPGQTFTFGRADTCTLCLDPDDKAISRHAGTILRDGDDWCVINESEKRSFTIVNDFNLPSVLGPKRRVVVEGRMRVIVNGAPDVYGAVPSHVLVLHAPRAAGVRPVVPRSGLVTSFGEDVRFPEDDRKAVVAVIAGYLLEGARYDPSPRTYEAAAARLGWSPGRVRKRIENLRDRLTRSGVPNLNGPNALSALAEYMLTTGRITRDDLKLIGY